MKPVSRPVRHTAWHTPVAMRYTAIHAKTKTGYSAHAPDLPGCVAAGSTLTETKRLMAEAVALHIKGMKEDGLPIPKPTTIAAPVEVVEA